MFVSTPTTPQLGELIVITRNPLLSMLPFSAICTPLSALSLSRAHSSQDLTHLLGSNHAHSPLLYLELFLFGMYSNDIPLSTSS